MWKLIQAGWNPANPTTEQSTRILKTMERIGGLTPHEERVLVQIAEGEQIPSIAEHCGQTKDAVKKTQSRIRLKVGARTNAEAVAVALREGLIA